MPQAELMIENSARATYEDMEMPLNADLSGHVADLSSHVADVIEIVPLDTFDAHGMVPQIIAKEQGSATNTTLPSDKVPHTIVKEKCSCLLFCLTTQPLQPLIGH
jgi:hypothetical protein